MTKLVEPLYDSDLATQLLHMCPIKWQMAETIPLSTRALLWVIENIKTIIKVNDKTPSNNKAKGDEEKGTWS